MSALLEFLPTFSGSVLIVSRLARAILSNVDRMLGICTCGASPCRVAAFACNLASSKSSLVSVGGAHKILILFPRRHRALIARYIRCICPCPDCCRGRLIANATALFQVSTTTFRNLSFGSRLQAVAIAVSSPEYGFWSIYPCVKSRGQGCHDGVSMGRCLCLGGSAYPYQPISC